MPLTFPLIRDNSLAQAIHHAYPSLSHRPRTFMRIKRQLPCHYTDADALVSYKSRKNKYLYFKYLYLHNIF